MDDSDESLGDFQSVLNALAEPLLSYPQNTGSHPPGYPGVAGGASVVCVHVARTDKNLTAFRKAQKRSTAYWK